MNLMKRIKSAFKAWRIGRLNWVDLTDNFSAKSLNKKPKEIQDYIVGNLLLMVYCLGSRSTVEMMIKLRSTYIPESPYIWIFPVVSALLVDLHKSNMTKGNFFIDLEGINRLMRDRELLKDTLRNMNSFKHAKKLGKVSKFDMMQMTKLKGLNDQCIYRLEAIMTDMGIRNLIIDTYFPTADFCLQVPMRYTGILHHLLPNPQQDKDLNDHFAKEYLQEEDIEFIRSFK